jgi:hypothetical protein
MLVIDPVCQLMDWINVEVSVIFSELDGVISGAIRQRTGKERLEEAGSSSHGTGIFKPLSETRLEPREVASTPRSAGRESSS